MEISKIKEEIIKGIEIATKEKGYKLVRNVWRSDSEKCACAFGCYLIAHEKEVSNPFPKLREAFSVDNSWLNDFIKGFDNLNLSPIFVQEAWDLGQEIATKCLE